VKCDVLRLVPISKTCRMVLGYLIHSCRLSCIGWAWAVCRNTRISVSVIDVLSHVTYFIAKPFKIFYSNYLRFVICF
jgi:hypothetical protein